MPKDAKLELTTMNFIGLPRITRVNVSDLRSARERFGIVNYIYLREGEKRKWWARRGVRRFAVHGGVRISQGTGVWENVVKFVAKRSV
jgi:paired amphipathic helix protein Sin3a